MYSYASSPSMQSLPSGSSAPGLGFLPAVAVAAGASGPAAPFILAAAAAIGPLISLIKGLIANSGCGQTCVVATKYADQAGAAMKKLKDDYFAQPVRYRSSQQAVLSNMEELMSALEQACSNPALGDAGRRCISERLVRGGTAPWCPTKTGCDYYATLVDPVANDTGVVEDSAAFLASSPTGAIAGVSPAALILPAGLLLLALAL